MSLGGVVRPIMLFTPTHPPLRRLYKGFLIPPMVFTLKIVAALSAKILETNIVCGLSQKSEVIQLKRK
jgi:hypothetical protein